MAEPRHCQEMVRDAVLSEPVSSLISLKCREFTGKTRFLRLFRRHLGLQNPQNSAILRGKFPAHGSGNVGCASRVWLHTSLGVSAMKGNRLAQSTMAELVRGIEEEGRKLRVDHYATAIEYKWGWEQEIEHARKHGLPEPTPLPHPADVIIDARTAEVRYAGPRTPEEKERWDRMLAFRDERQDFVTFAAESYRGSDEGDTGLRARRLAAWQHAQALFDRINNPLPERYRIRLQDRGYGEGFSREEQA